MAAIVFAILLLAVIPASAAPEDPAVPVQAETEESLWAQVWQWLASLIDTATAGTGGETSSGSCSVLAPGGRGCAIDPNGVY
jgi:NADPH:quinone reductase-like Zn-dependent oxidoreductase